MGENVCGETQVVAFSGGTGCDVGNQRYDLKSNWCQCQAKRTSWDFILWQVSDFENL